MTSTDQAGRRGGWGNAVAQQLVKWRRGFYRGLLRQLASCLFFSFNLHLSTGRAGPLLLQRLFSRRGESRDCSLALELGL